MSVRRRSSRSKCIYIHHNSFFLFLIFRRFRCSDFKKNREKIGRKSATDTNACPRSFASVDGKIPGKAFQKKGSALRRHVLLSLLSASVEDDRGESVWAWCCLLDKRCTHRDASDPPTCLLDKDAKFLGVFPSAKRRLALERAIGKSFGTKTIGTRTDVVD